MPKDIVVILIIFVGIIVWWGIAPAHATLHAETVGAMLGVVAIIAVVFFAIRGK